MVFCSECGTKSDGGKFCPECGNKFAVGGAAPAAAPVKAAFKAAPVKAAPAVSTGGPARSGSQGWSIYDGCFSSNSPKSSGNGMAAFKSALPESDCAWGIYTYDEQYVVRIKWRPNSVGAIKKVKANQTEQKFLNFAGDKTKVTVEVLGKKNLTDASLWECIKPGSGSKVIDD